MSHTLAIDGGQPLRSTPYPTWPQWGAEEERAVLDVLHSGRWWAPEGTQVTGLESEFAAYHDARHGVAVTNGSAALEVCLMAAGLGWGDEVITTPYTFIATASAVLRVGATPVFVDVDDNWCMDHRRIRAAITPRTKAIMPVHLFGQCADMDAIMSIAKKHNLKVIEDNAQGVGSTWGGKMSCSFGDIGTLSFFPSKNLGAFGDGGLIATDDDAVADLARMLRAHGSKKKYHNEVLGYNSRLDAMQAAFLRVKLPHIDLWNARRRGAAERYGRLFEAVDGVKAPEVMDGHVFHQYTIRLEGVARDAVQQALTQAGISTMVYYPVPQHRLPGGSSMPRPCASGCSRHSARCICTMSSQRSNLKPTAS